jgi:hypothetical protein
MVSTPRWASLTGERSPHQVRLLSFGQLEELLVRLLAVAEILGDQVVIGKNLIHTPQQESREVCREEMGVHIHNLNAV